MSASWCGGARGRAAAKSEMAAAREDTRGESGENARCGARGASLSSAQQGNAPVSGGALWPEARDLTSASPAAPVLARAIAGRAPLRATRSAHLGRGLLGRLYERRVPECAGRVGRRGQGARRGRNTHAQVSLALASPPPPNQGPLPRRAPCARLAAPRAATAAQDRAPAQRSALPTLAATTWSDALRLKTAKAMVLCLGLCG